MDAIVGCVVGFRVLVWVRIWFRINLHQMHAICFNGIPTCGIHGPKVKDIISKKIGTKRATLIIRNDQLLYLLRKTTEGYTTPAHNKLLAPMNDFIRRQFANQDPSRTNMLILALGHRMAQAAKLRGAHAQMVHAISRNFTIKNTNQIMEQLIQRCQGNLDQYIRDEILMNNHCLEIVHFLNLTMLDRMLPVDNCVIVSLRSVVVRHLSKKKERRDGLSF